MSVASLSIISDLLDKKQLHIDNIYSVVLYISLTPYINSQTENQDVWQHVKFSIRFNMILFSSSFDITIRLYLYISY